MDGEDREERTEKQIDVRQVTDVQVSWTEKERGGPGAFAFQLILDNGADEYLIRATAEDAGVLMQLMSQSKSVTFDWSRTVLIFNKMSLA